MAAFASRPRVRPRTSRGIERRGGGAGLVEQAIIQQARPTFGGAAGRALQDLQGGRQALLQPGGAVGGNGGLVERHAPHEAHEKADGETARHQAERQRGVRRGHRNVLRKEDANQRDDGRKGRGPDRPGQARLKGAHQEQAAAHASKRSDQGLHGQ